MKTKNNIIPVNCWARCKNNNIMRYVTRHTNKECFEDDGKVSGLEPSPYCRFEHYEQAEKMNTKTTVIVKLAIEGLHNFPKASELFPEVAFLSDMHRHIFHITASKQVFHDDRDTEFILFKRKIENYLRKRYQKDGNQCLNFGSMSCEMIGRELLEEFECEYIEVFEDNENGARVERI